MRDLAFLLLDLARMFRPRMRSSRAWAPGSRDRHKRPASCSFLKTKARFNKIMNHYQLVEATLDYVNTFPSVELDTNFLAREMGVNNFFFHEAFYQWSGTTPEFFLSLLKPAAIQAAMERTRLDFEKTAIQMASLVLQEDGVGEEVRWGAAETPFGRALVGVQGEALAHFSFRDNGGLEETQGGAASVTRTPEAEEIVERIVSHDLPPIKLKGTPFQQEVWKALLKIPDGAIVTYQDVARLAGNPRGVRAVASAIAANPIGWAVPCHRVIRKNGDVGKYRWGKPRKQALIAREQILAS